MEATPSSALAPLSPTLLATSVVYALGAVFDTGGSFAISGHKAIFSDLRACTPFATSLVAGGDVLTCTHRGVVPVVIGGHRLRNVGYYCANATSLGTVVPGSWFDTGDTANGSCLWFKGKHQGVSVYDHDELLATFPRALSTDVL